MGIHHHVVDANGGIARSNGLVQTISIIAVGTELPPSMREVIKQVFPNNADIVIPSLEKNMVNGLLRLRNHALDSAEPKHS